MHNINKATENSHVKSNLVHMFHRIQKVGQLSLIEFKDILTLEEMEQAKLELQKPEKRTWIPIPRAKFLEYIHSVSIHSTRVVTATDGHTRSSVTSDKVLVRQIRVNAMLTSDKVKPELLCPRWLPRRCHIGWLDVHPLYCTGCKAHSSMEGANGCHRGAYGQRVGHAWMK
jgi:hypothetical protein